MPAAAPLNLNTLRQPPPLHQHRPNGVPSPIGDTVDHAERPIRTATHSELPHFGGGGTYFLTDLVIYADGLIDFAADGLAWSNPSMFALHDRDRDRDHRGSHP